MTIHPEVLIHALGWTLLHFLWQGVLVAAIFAFVTELLKSSSANKRYVAACGALCLMAALPAATFFVRIRPASLQNSSATVINTPDLPPQEELIGVAIRSKESATETADAPTAAPTVTLRQWSEERFAPWLKPIGFSIPSLPQNMKDSRCVPKQFH
jgi:hypothetical protein